MPIPLRRIAPLLCALFIATPAAAQPEQAPWYQIELLVFARNGEGAGGSETWPGNPGAPDWSRAQPLQPGLAQAMYGMTSTGPTTSGDEHKSQSYRLLPERQFQLKQPANYLARTGRRMETLLHVAWQQPVSSRQKGQWLYLRTPATVAPVDGSASAPRLEGIVLISLSRYLHINLDLLQHRLAAPGAVASADATLLSPRYRSYRFQAHRRMRSSEIHYIDHPLMGALVQITPLQAQSPALSKPATDQAAQTEPPAEEDAAPEALGSESATPSEGPAD